MQQPITRRDSYAPALSAVVGGSAVELSSVQVDRELPDPVQGGALTAASASLVVADGPDVVETVATPWDPGSSWPPVPETGASVSMDTGAGPVQVLTNGRVVSASGGTGGREVSVEVADQYQSLDKTISWDAVASAMPALEWDWNLMRYVGLHGVSVADMILRHCGWYSTPPRLSWIALSIPGQGSMWPERGDCLNAGRRSAGTRGYPVWQNAPWGLGVSDFEGEYRMTGTRRTIKGQGRLEMTAMVTAASEFSRMDVLSTGGAGLARLQWTGTSVVVQVRGTSGSYITAVSLPLVSGFVYTTIQYVSDTSVDVSLRVGDRTVSGTVTVDPRVTTDDGGTVRITSTGASAGFQVAYPGTSAALAGWVPNTQIRPRTATRNHLDVLPSVEGENCADLLTQLCEAETATFWIDEAGVLQWWDLARLEGRSSVATLTSGDDIAERGFEWTHSQSSMRSRAAVKWRHPLKEWSPAHRVTLFQGSGKTMQPGDDSIEEWLNTPDDEVWIMPDLTVDRLGVVDMTDFNYGDGTASGAVVAGSESQADVWADQVTGTLVMTVERVTDRAFKMHTSWTGNVPVVMRTPSEASSSQLWRVRRNFNLPIVRGKAKFMFTDRVTYSAQSGPEAAPEYQVDAGWWIQTESQAQYVADYYGARITVPQPVLSSIDLVPIPGLQLGDMVTVRDEHVSRLTVRGVVVADSRSIDADMGITHSVAIRPIYVTRNGVTWQEWATAARPKTRAQWAASQGGTWAEWGASPLLKEQVI